MRGHMIDTYKIVNGKYDRVAAPTLKSVHSSLTRGHELEIAEI